MKSATSEPHVEDYATSRARNATGREVTSGNDVTTASQDSPGRDLQAASLSERPEAPRSEGVDRLSVALAATDANARLDAAAALGNVDDARAETMLAQLALDDADPSVRAEAVYTLGARGGVAQDVLFQRALEDVDPEVRHAAITALESLGGERSVELLSTALQDGEISLRVAAVYALSDIGGDTAIQLLRQASQDQHREVREAAEDLLAGQ